MMVLTKEYRVYNQYVLLMPINTHSLDFPPISRVMCAGVVGGVTFPAVLASVQLAVFKPLGMTYCHGNRLASIAGGVAILVAGFTASVTMATSLELLQATTTQSKTKLKVTQKDVLLSSLSSMVVFRALGGRFSRVLPSSLLSPGAYARDWLPTTRGMHYATDSQREAIQAIGQRHGCHSCGSKRGVANFIADHQPPNKVLLVNSKMLTQRFLPQCKHCSLQQGGVLSGINYASNPAHIKPHPLSLRLYHMFLPLPFLFAYLHNGDNERNEEPLQVTVDTTPPVTMETAIQTETPAAVVPNKRTPHTFITNSDVEELVSNFPLLIVWQRLVNFLDSFRNPSDSFHVTLWSFIIIAAWGTL